MAKKSNITSETLNLEIEGCLKHPVSLKSMDKYLELVKKYDEFEVSAFDNPKSVSGLTDISGLKSYLNDGLKSEIKACLEAKDISGAVDIIIGAVQIDANNVELADYVMEAFLKRELYTEAIELYKTMFVATSNPVYFERIGDVHIIKEDYESAIDSYLSCAEISENYPDIYVKLADIFGRTGDTVSQQACLEQVKILKGENAK